MASRRDPQVRIPAAVRDALREACVELGGSGGWDYSYPLVMGDVLSGLVVVWLQRHKRPKLKAIGKKLATARLPRWRP